MAKRYVNMTATELYENIKNQEKRVEKLTGIYRKEANFRLQKMLREQKTR